MECPYCSSNRINKNNGICKCQSCGRQFEDIYNQQRSVNLEVNSHHSESVNKPIKRSTSKSYYDSMELSPEDIYEIGIKGTALIVCHDLECTGSGFLARDGGLVITNAHVIYDEEKDVVSYNLSVTINGVESPAKVVCYGDVNGSDVALLQLEKTNVKQHFLKIANSDTVRVGARVYAIGNSFGEGLCITSGIISDKDREVFNERCFMSDVAINSGNSGGPLMNNRGEVIAICVASKTDAKGMNYFIPINDVLDILKDYI